jgi:hypothetical protein
MGFKESFICKWLEEDEARLECLINLSLLNLLRGFSTHKEQPIKEVTKEVIEIIIRKLLKMLSAEFIAK